MFAFALITLLAQFIGNFDAIITPDESIYTYHIVDFRIGYVSRVIQGQIFQWIFPNPSRQLVKRVSLVLFILVVFCASYFLEKLYLSITSNNKSIFLYLILIFCVSGSTFHIFYRQLGMLDVYWVYAFLFFLIFLQNKKTWFLIPFSFVFMVAVHYGSLLTYIPLMAIILLYKASLREKTSLACPNVNLRKPHRLKPGGIFQRHTSCRHPLKPPYLLCSWLRMTPDQEWNDPHVIRPQS